MNAFAGADEIFVVTITSGLSGTYGSAMAAKDPTSRSTPKSKIHVFDSLSTGPEMQLLIEKLASLLDTDLSFEEIRDAGEAYLRSTRMFFSLQSPPQSGSERPGEAGGRAIGILNIRILATASPKAPSPPVEKCRGEKKPRVPWRRKCWKPGTRAARSASTMQKNPGDRPGRQAALLEKFSGGRH